MSHQTATISRRFVTTSAFNLAEAPIRGEPIVIAHRVEAGGQSDVVTSDGIDEALGSPDERLDCGVFSCAYLGDVDGATDVADAAKRWGFANPGLAFDRLPGDLPLFIARAGHEQDPGLHQALDRFVAAALARNLPVTCVNFAEAPHAFEMFHDTAATREVMRQMLRFARFHLAGPTAEGVNL